jgi:hypothetical protein
MEANNEQNITSGESIRAELQEMIDQNELETPPTVQGPLTWRPFPVEILPEPVRSFVRESAKATGCDPSYIGLPILSALASAIGNSRCIQLKRSWREPSIIWTVIVGESGTMKSPAIELALRSVRKRQQDAMRDYTDQLDQYEVEKLHYERDLARWKQSKTSDKPPAKPEQPVPDRYCCDDTTVEALAVLLQNQLRGLLMARDELAGWIGGFDRYAQGKGGDVAKWLEMFGGRSITVDRKTSGSIYVPRASVSIAGGIQPDTLYKALGKTHFKNGLAARLLLACPPRTVHQWTEVEIEHGIELATAQIFDRLYSLQPVVDENDEPQPVALRLTPEGKKAWIKFYNDHAKEQARLTGDLSAAWSKLEGYAARLALVIHLVRCVSGDETGVSIDEVDEVSIAAGVELSRWFGQEARRVYDILGESDENRDQRQLIELIRRKGGTVTGRDLMRASRLYPAADDAEKALQELADAGLGRWEFDNHDGGPGRPARRFTLTETVDVDRNGPGVVRNRDCVNVGSVNSANDTRRTTDA